MKNTSLIILSLGVLFLASCANNTPTKRIENNTLVYQKLSPRQQELVRQGTIENGMSQQAVYLAWGNPDARSQGQEGNETFEKWTYGGLTPVYTTSFNYGFGYYGGSRRYRGYYPYDSFGTDVLYVPYRAAWVKFINGRVTSWQRGR